MKKVKRRGTRILSLFLAFVMMCTLWDATAFAKTENASALMAQGSEEKSEQATESGQAGDASSSDKSVLKSLNFDIPADSAYKQDEMQTGTKSLGTMSELVLTYAGDTNQSWVYKDDGNGQIRTGLSSNAMLKIASYCAGDSMAAYTITEAVDADGDGKKELLVELYLSGTKKGQDILMTLSDIRTQKTLFKAQPTGGYIDTTDNISSWEIEGLLSMCAGDFDGDGCEEVAVYTPNNKNEKADASIANTLQIKIYKLGTAPTELAEPQQVIDIASVGTDDWVNCQGWLYSHVWGSKQFYSLPYMSLTAGDMDQDGIDDLFSVANFSTQFRGAGKEDKVTWNQMICPNTALGSVLDVYKGQSSGLVEQVVTKRVLIGNDDTVTDKWNDGAGVLRNARVTIANVTGANSNEIVIAGNYTGIYNGIGENDQATKSRYVWIEDDNGSDPKLLVGYTTADQLVKDQTKTASLTYNWTMQTDGYDPLHYYNGYKNDLDPGSEPVQCTPFAAYGSAQPDTIAVEGQLFTYSEEDGKLKCDSYVTPSRVDSDKSNVWITSQVAGNVTNDPFGRETLYYIMGKKKSGQELYWNDVISVWGVVDAEKGTKGYDGKCYAGASGKSAIHFSLAMCDIDDDTSFIKYEEGNTDVYYSNVQLLSVLQAAPVYGDLGDDYVSGAETSYGKSSGSSTGTGESYQVSAGVILGFEQEVSFFGLFKTGIEATTQVSVSAGWENEKTAQKEFTTTYNTDGTEDVVVLYTVPYVRYNGKIYIPTYTLPTRAEYDARMAFFNELKKNIESYQDKRAGVTGGVYAKPKDGYNDEYTTNVTKDNYDYQIRTLQSYAEWLDNIESQMEGFEGSEGLKWGAEIEGGWEDYFLCVPQTPIITSVSADTYNKIAADCKDLQSLYGTALPKGYTAGSPDTYVSNINELKARTTVKENSVVTGKTNSGKDDDGFISSTAISASSSAPSQTIAFTEENAKKTTVGGGLSAEVTATAGGVKAGVAFSTEYEASWSSSTTSGCEFSGQVPNLPNCPDYMESADYSSYDYAWKLVSYEAEINGSTVPVVGYYTKFTDPNKIPPSAPSNLELEDVKSDSIILTWDGGSRSADHYNVYQVSGKGADKTYDIIGTVSGKEEGPYHFTHSDLTPNQTYTYVVRACNEDDTVFSIYTDEITTTTPVPEFDVTIKLSGIDSGKTYSAGTEQTLTASLVTQNYPDSEIFQCSWQVNDGSGWKKISGATEDSYTWTLPAKSDGYQYRCAASVTVDSRLYLLYSEPVMLHVKKLQVQVTIQAAKKAGAADPSSEFGLAARNGDVLKLTAQVQAEEGEDPSGVIAFAITDKNDASNVNEYKVIVSAEGIAEKECRIQKAGRYTITARYIENERIQEAVSSNSLSYYAYVADVADDRAQGQEMEDAIYGEDVTIENAFEKKEEIEDLQKAYDNLTDEQKDFVESEAKAKLKEALDILEAAEVVAKIGAIGTVTSENAAQKKTLIEEAQKAYDALTDAQKAYVSDNVKNMLEAAQEAYKKAISGGAGDKTDQGGTDDKTPTASLSLNMTMVTLYTGKASNSVTITPTVTGKSKTVTWKTSNSKVARVKNGKITAVGKGTAIVTATANKISKTVQVTVKDPTITIKNGKKKFTKSKLTVKKNKKVVLTVTVNPKNSGISITKLTKKQKKIASVTLKKGKITIKGKKRGSFTLKIKSGKATKKIKITVK